MFGLGLLISIAILTVIFLIIGYVVKLVCSYFNADGRITNLILLVILLIWLYKLLMMLGIA